MAQKSTQNTTGPKPQYSRERIIEVAISLADTRGIDAVSIRAIASNLGTGAASLYRYVKSFDELTGLMVDRVSAEYDFSTCTGPAIEQLLDIARQGRRIMRHHPWVPLIVLQKQVMTPNALAYLEQGLIALSHTTLGAAEKLHTIAMLNSITATFTLYEINQDEHAGSSVSSEPLELGAYPHLLQVVGQIQHPMDLDSAFERAIVTYLQGMGIK